MQTQPAYHRISRKDDAPCPSSVWDDPDIARLALRSTHSDGEVLDAVSEFLCSDRSAEYVADLVRRLEAIGESAMEDHIAARYEAAA